MAITTDQYSKCGITQKLGEIAYYHSLGDISNMLHIPVPFLEKENFYKRQNTDELFHKISEQESARLIEQRNRFRDMYAQLCKNIIALIELKKNWQKN